MIRVLTILLCIIFVTVSCKNKTGGDEDISADHLKITRYYLIRHAEKDRTDPENNNPELTDAGKARAEHWAAYFDTIELDAVYSTNYIRTRMTATPTAEHKQLDILTYDPGQLYNDDFKQYTKDKTVLVVGHSNTTPEFVNKILKKKQYPEMDDNDNSSMYVVTLRNNIPSAEVRSVQ